jgi:hypothetical protein
VCGPCAGSPIDYRCSACGAPGCAYLAGRCARCSIQLLVTRLLADDTGAVPDHLLPLVNMLSTTSRPDSTLRWLTRPCVQALLTALPHCPPRSFTRCWTSDSLRPTSRCTCVLKEEIGYWIMERYSKLTRCTIVNYSN